jgi:hypothetical protein
MDKTTTISELKFIEIAVYDECELFDLFFCNLLASIQLIANIPVNGSTPASM